MRAIFVQFVFLLLVPMILTAPYVGVLVYYWFTWLNPHKLAWGGLGIEWGKVIALATLVAWLASKEPKKLPLSGVTLLILMLFFWTCLTTLLAVYPKPAWDFFQQWAKIVLMVIVAICMMNTRTRLHAWIWITVISIGYYGLKGGLFTILSGGNYYVLGPPGTAIFNTNELARALLMTVPLMYYLAFHCDNRLVRIGMFGLTALTCLATFGTTSRSAFVTLLLMCLLLWFRSRHKVKIVAAGALVVAAMVAVLPAERLEGLTAKYSTIQDYEEDSSFQGRVGSWGYAWNVVTSRPFTGNGFKTFENGHGLASHSNYFQMLGEHGYIGLILYLALGIAAVTKATMVYRVCRKRPNLYWARDLALLLQITIIGYFFGGLTKNHAFFELYYMELGMLVCLSRIVAQELALEAMNKPATYGYWAQRSHQVTT